MALILAAVAVSGCDLGVRADAAKGVQTFLAAARTGDRPAFEAAIDRPALREDLRGQLIEVARAQGLEVEGGPSDFALDRMIAPEAFRLVQAETGQALPAAPSAAQLAAMMTVVDRRRVCLRDAAREDRCLLTFAKEKTGAAAKASWRLVGMQATDLKITVASGD